MTAKNRFKTMLTLAVAAMATLIVANTSANATDISVDATAAYALTGPVPE
jgi:hypothetical protein